MFGSQDITFCKNKCDNTRCMRNPANIADKTIPHSFAYFDDCAGVPKENETIYKDKTG